MVIRKKTSGTANRTATRTTAPAKKRTAAPAAPVKKSVPAKKSAAPARPVKKSAPAPVAKKSAPPARTATGAATKRPVGKKPGSGAVGNPKTSVTAHDVLRAGKAADILLAQYNEAKAHHEKLHAAYWEGYDGAVDGAVEHAAKMAEEVAKEVPKRTGRPATKEGPARKALAPEPKVAGEYYDEDTVRGYSIRELRDLAEDLADRGIITERKLKNEIYAQMEAAGLFREDGSAPADEDDEYDDEDGEEGEEDLDEYEDDETEDADSADDESDDEEDDGGDDEGDYSLDDLKEMSLKELQDVAENWGIVWKGLKQKELLAAIVAAGTEDEDEDSEEEEFEDGEESEEFEDEEPDEDEEEEDDEEYEELELTVEDIENMETDELLRILAQVEVRVPAKSKNNPEALRELLLTALSAGDDSDEE